MKMMVENSEDNKEYEVECLARSIKEVELAKKDRPAVYNEALKKLKGEAKVMMSIDDLKAKAQELAMDEPKSKDKSEVKEEEKEEQD